MTQASVCDPVVVVLLGTPSCMYTPVHPHTLSRGILKLSYFCCFNMSIFTDERVCPTLSADD
jgi:hypothetical protein